MEQAADTVLDYTVHRAGGVPGVVAMVTDRRGNVYEGAAGVREPGKDQAMTADSVMAIFSTTKAITRVTVMQLVEEGRISLANAAGFDVEDVEGVEDLRIAVDEACTLLLSDGSVDEQRIVDAPAGGGVAITVEPSPPQRLDGRPVEKLTHEILSAVVDECATETPDDARPLTSTA